MERTIEIDGIPDELLSRLDERANQVGVDRSSYVRWLIEQAVAPRLNPGTLGEALAPSHEFTEAHAIDEREVEEFFAGELADARRQRRERGESVRPVN